MTHLRSAYFLLAWVCGLLGANAGGPARAAEIRLEIKPSATGAAITASDWPHQILYDPARQAQLLLWLPGTNGRPVTGPLRFYRTAVAQGYRVVALSYIDTPAVSQVCINHAASTCPETFREKRVFGDDTTAAISDSPGDAIVNRLQKLLTYLAVADPAGHWDQYLVNGSPRWDRIAVSGHSQGGGMAAFIAKREAVARVIMFSGGWDQSSPGRVAGWYSATSATPPSRWYGNYNVREPYARIIAETYKSLGIPADHTFALELPVPPGRDAHGQGMMNPHYTPQWMEMLGQPE